MREPLNVLTLAPDRMIEVVCNDRLGKKVRVKCKYPPEAEGGGPGLGRWVRAGGGRVGSRHVPLALQCPPTTPHRFP